MAKKLTPSKTTSKSTPVRNTAVVPKQRTTVTPSVSKIAPSIPKKVITQEQIAKRAYEIYASGNGGSELENWTRAERELSGK